LTTLTYPHVLTAGQPENVNDLNDNLNAVTTWAAGNIDTTNLAATAKPATLMGAYRPVSEASFYFTSIYNAGTYMANASGVSVLNGGFVSTTLALIPINLADHAVSGLTTQFRVQASTITNTVAPAANFTFGLYGIASTGGTSSTILVNLTAAVAGSGATRVAPSATSNYVDWSSDFTGANGTWLLGIALSATPAANSMTQCTLRLMVHNI
jgi:hypothetical protein